MAKGNRLSCWELLVSVEYEQYEATQFNICCCCVLESKQLSWIMEWTIPGQQW